MVRQSHQSDDAVFVWLVFVNHAGRRRVVKGRQTENAPSDLVSKGGGNILGCDRLCEAVFMGGAEFSNIAKRGRDDKNTALLFGMSDRNALLRNLIWIKSSLENLLFHK